MYNTEIKNGDKYIMSNGQKNIEVIYQGIDGNSMMFKYLNKDVFLTVKKDWFENQNGEITITKEAN